MIVPQPQRLLLSGYYLRYLQRGAKKGYRFTCIGNNFALMEATLVVATAMQRYRLDLMLGQTVKAHPKGTLQPRPGV